MAIILLLCIIAISLADPWPVDGGVPVVKFTSEHFDEVLKITKDDNNILVLKFYKGIFLCCKYSHRLMQSMRAY